MRLKPLLGVALVLLPSVACASEAIAYTTMPRDDWLFTHSGSVNNGVAANYRFDSADNRRNIKVTGAP